MRSFPLAGISGDLVVVRALLLFSQRGAGGLATERRAASTVYCPFARRSGDCHQPVATLVQIHGDASTQSQCFLP